MVVRVIAYRPRYYREGDIDPQPPTSKRCPGCKEKVTLQYPHLAHSKECECGYIVVFRKVK